MIVEVLFIDFIKKNFIFLLVLFFLIPTKWKYCVIWFNHRLYIRVHGCVLCVSCPCMSTRYPPSHYCLGSCMHLIQSIKTEYCHFTLLLTMLFFFIINMLLIPPFVPLPLTTLFQSELWSRDHTLLSDWSSSADGRGQLGNVTFPWQHIVWMKGLSEEKGRKKSNRSCCKNLVEERNRTVVGTVLVMWSKGPPGHINNPMFSH